MAENNGIAIEAEVRKPAGFWIRVLSILLDVVIMILAGVTLCLPLVILSAMQIFPTAKTVDSIRIAISFMSIFYEIWFIGKYGQTPGKMALNIKVFRVSGKPMGYKTAFFRWIGKNVSVFTFGIGFLVACFNGKKRALHDYIVGTEVAYVGKPNRIVVIGLSCLAAVVVIAGPVLMVALANHPSIKLLLVQNENNKNPILIKCTSCGRMFDVRFPGSTSGLMPDGKSRYFLCPDCSGKAGTWTTPPTSNPVSGK